MPEGSTKLYSKKCLVILVVLLAIGIVIDISTLGASPWVRSNDSYYGFKGSIQTLIESDGQCFKHSEGQTYSDLREIVCDLKSSSSDNDYDALCWLFSGLESSFSGTIVGILLGIAWSVLFIILLFLSRKKKQSLFKCLILVWLLAMFTHIGTATGYISSNSVVFSEDCGTLIQNRLPGNLCADSGAILLLFGLLYHIVLMLLITCLSCIARTRLARHGVPTTQMVPIDNVNTTHPAIFEPSKNAPSPQVIMHTHAAPPHQMQPYPYQQPPMYHQPPPPHYAQHPSPQYIQHPPPHYAQHPPPHYAQHPPPQYAQHPPPQYGQYPPMAGPPPMQPYPDHAYSPVHPPNNRPLQPEYIAPPAAQFEDIALPPRPADEEAHAQQSDRRSKSSSSSK